MMFGIFGRTQKTHEVQDFALRDEVVETIHHFLDGSIPVPPMHVEDVDVCGAQFLQASFHTNVHRFDVVSDVVHLLRDSVIARLKAGRVLEGQVSWGALNLRVPLHKPLL
jgi:hypothetical protein